MIRLQNFINIPFSCLVRGRKDREVALPFIELGETSMILLVQPSHSYCRFNGSKPNSQFCVAFKGGKSYHQINEILIEESKVNHNAVLVEVNYNVLAIIVLFYGIKPSSLVCSLCWREAKYIILQSQGGNPNILYIMYS